MIRCVSQPEQKPCNSSMRFLLSGNLYLAIFSTRLSDCSVSVSVYSVVTNACLFNHALFFQGDGSNSSTQTLELVIDSAVSFRRKVRSFSLGQNVSKTASGKYPIILCPIQILNI